VKPPPCSLTSAPAADQPEPEQQHQRADDGDADAGQVEAADPAPAQLGSDEAADHGADDTDQDGDEEPAGIIARHQKLGDGAGDQAEHDPCNDTHRGLLVAYRSVAQDRPSGGEENRNAPGGSPAMSSCHRTRSAEAPDFRGMPRTEYYVLRDGSDWKIR